VWLVRDLLLIPKFTITSSVIVPRKPLGETARRKRWQGYMLDVAQIPSAAKIPLVTAGVVREPTQVRADFARIAPVQEMKSDQRGWTLDVLRCVEKFGATEFTTQQSYEFESHLSALHPDNRHVRDKIRQQLQVLRDLGFLEHVGTGRWRKK
jgi:type II restriction enzyme